MKFDNPNQARFTPPLVSLIIPAYNEAGRVHQVLGAAQGVAEILEIIVVDDGSTDGTWAEIQQAAARDTRVRGVRCPINQGKGQALFTGARGARAPLLLFLDADLVGLTSEHVRQLIAPVASGRAEMAVGVFRGGALLTDLSHFVTPALSGQRCMIAARFFEIDETLAKGYGIETTLSLAARRNRWRCQHVKLAGVVHPPSEVHRGLWPGVTNRAKMYAEISQTWHRGQGWALVWQRPTWRTRLTLMILCLLLFGAISYNHSRAATSLQLENLSPLSIENYHRLLVIAPHPDDETIGAGGLLQAALDHGLEVHVVIITNGDGQPFGPLVLNGKVIPRADNYIAAGQLRQTEALAALKALGVPEEAVSFLGYPDGGLEQMWLADWGQARPTKARYTHAVSSPYASTYNPAASYCGNDLLQDLLEVMEDFQPDLVLVPHPNDEHSDHRAASNFSMMALALERAANAYPQPTILGYLVHYGYFPQPRNWHLHTPLLPPLPLSQNPQLWLQLGLTPEQVETKAAAIREHPSQLRLLGAFLPSFARPNELFYQMNVIELSVVDIENSLPLTQNAPPISVLPEPAQESARRLVVGSADLTALQIAQLGNQLWLSAQTHWPLLPKLQYTIKVKYPAGKTITHTWPGTAWRTAKDTFTFPVILEPGSEPFVLGFAAEVREGVVLDRSAWRFIVIYPLAP